MTRPPARTAPRLPRVSLRAALIGLVALANLAVFGAGLLWAQRAEGRVEAQRTLARTDLLGTLVGTLVDARGNLRSAALLRWDRWDEWFEDVQIAHFPDLGDPGRPALGLRLDPLGAAGRDPRHDEAEVLAAMRTAAGAIGNYRLTDATVYVTVEPCLMCVGAMVHARIGLVVFGAVEPKGGALVSTKAAHEFPGLNHRLEILGGVRAPECRALMQAFFQEKRGVRFS